MKFWITRLNATLVTELAYESSVKIQAPANQSEKKNIDQSQIKQTDADKQRTKSQEKEGGQHDIQKPIEQIQSSYQQNEKQEIQKKKKEQEATLLNNLRVYDELKKIINHSRILSLSIYENDLIYYSGEYQYYYRAKHNLLFILAKDPKQPINTSVLEIDSIILNVIKLFQQKSLVIVGSPKLPRKITLYQSIQFQRLAEKIKQVIYQTCFEKNQLHLKSLGQYTTNQQVILSESTIRINSIGDKLKKFEDKPKQFEEYTKGKIRRYKYKKWMFFVVLCSLAIASLKIYQYHNQHTI